MKYLFIFLLSILATSCTVPVKQSDIDAASYPTKPSQQEAEIQIRTALGAILKDPESLRLECQRVKKGWARQYRDHAPEFGWVVPCTANAKNSFGAYSGSKPYVFLFSSAGLKTLKGSSFRKFEEHVGYVE